ncbi:MAG: hypothetical protein ACI8ZB_004543 [Desulforhopalus sp.]|jgi:uncharacterized protein (DUF58 family)
MQTNNIPDDRSSVIFTVPLMLFMVGIVLMVALLNDDQNLILLCLLLLSVVGVAKLWGNISLRGVTCSSSVDRKRLFPGEILTLSVQIENMKFLPVWLRIRVAGATDMPVEFAEEETDFSHETSLLWHQRVNFNWQMSAKRRGVNSLGPLHLLAGDLLGFFPGQRMEQAPEVIVYPRIVPLKPLPLPGRDLFGLPGASSPVHDPVYLSGTREYQHLQPARYIHWKASARHNQLQEKVFTPSWQQKILLVVDVQGFADNRASEEFEKTLEVVASLAVSMVHKGISVGLIANGRLDGKLSESPGSAAVPVMNHRATLPAILEVLARTRMETAEPLQNTLQKSINVPWGVSCVLFSHAADQTNLISYRALTQRRIPTICLVAKDDSEKEPATGLEGKVICSDDIRLEMIQ